MANPDSLTPFKPGDPRASEAGKKSKRGVSIKHHLQKVLDSGEVDVNDLVKSMYDNASKGNSGIVKIIMEYLEGKVPDKIIADVESKEKVEIKLVD